MRTPIERKTHLASMAFAMHVPVWRQTGRTGTGRFHVNQGVRGKPTTCLKLTSQLCPHVERKRRVEEYEVEGLRRTSEKRARIEGRELGGVDPEPRQILAQGLRRASVTLHQLHAGRATRAGLDA